MSNYRWRFYDPVLDVTYQVARNPDQMGNPYVSNQTASLGVSPVDGRSRASRTPDVAMDWQFSGMTHDQAHYDALVEWCAKPYRVTLTDHLDRVLTVRLTQFEGKPKSPQSSREDADWKFRYTVKGYIYPRGIVVIGEAAAVTAQVPLRLSVTGVAATATAYGVPGTVL